MSQIGTGNPSGVRFATQPLSNVYTALLFVAAVALVVSLVLTAWTLRARYESVLPVGGGNEQALKARDQLQRDIEARDQNLEQGREQLRQLTDPVKPEGAAAGGDGDGTAPLDDAG